LFRRRHTAATSTLQSQPPQTQAHTQAQRASHIIRRDADHLHRAGRWPGREPGGRHSTKKSATRATMQGAMRTAPRMPACVPNERARAHPSLHALAAWPHGRQRSASTAGVHSEAGRSAPGAGELGKLPAQRLLPRGELLTHGARPSGGPAFCFEHPSHPPAPAPARCREPTRLPSGKPACRQAFVFFARHQRSKAHNRAPSAGGPHADQVPL
jgi:hypothetical protein